MRKLAMLALGLGVAALFRRHAAKTGTSPSDLLANLAANAIASLTGAARTKAKTLADRRDAA